MKSIFIFAALLLSITGNALAGSGYESCIKEEKTLKAQEADNCSGLKYLFNPSGCYATQKALREYKGGKCRQIGLAENVDFSAQKVIPEKKVATTNLTEQKKIETDKLQQTDTIEQLREENNRLKAEIIRLKTENEQLRKQTRQP